MKPFPFLPVSDKKLTKTERKEERARIDQYYQKKLAELQKYIYESFGEFYAGKMNVFELDRIIHIYHKQSQELFSFITAYNSNDSLRFILAIIDAEERGEWSWQPKTRQEKKNK
ncbi:MAG: hypothetical protein J5U17_06755 [Candidatus Methanoperedens sp.]|jgi:hypothetical protein|nr:hypothetical protein [Candidatus Methanoperedens sp.]MCE8425463.1 hypothetical protein [Candidatus Methanoperedens sp.]MCE8428609.1 hypothetical protein [Candidatus Methanoperedens sp.]